MQALTKTALGGIALLGVLAILNPQRVKALAGAPVQVVNTTSQQIPVMNTDEPGRNPVQGDVLINSNANSGNAIIYTVPRFHRLVVQNLSFHCQSARGVSSADLQTVLNNHTYNTHFSGGDKVYVSGQDLYYNVAGQQTTAYADAGDVVVSFAGNDLVNHGVGTMYCNATLAGYLVSTPLQIIIP